MKVGLELMTHIRMTCSACSWLSYNIPRVLGKEHLHHVTILPAQRSFQGIQEALLHSALLLELACVVFCFVLK